ncbi:MetQ/NlpA family ABC transporter substrate-binding protein [Clostridium neuense]|uniref:Lipoprotein n=1 Tax=Clostridium neuense TaxID=1728934 RepID=A0ABW8TLN2_9CLOT
MKIRRIAALFLTLSLGVSLLSGCKSSTAANTSSKKQVIKLGVTGEDHKIWDALKEDLKKDNIDLKIVSFSDYVRPNMALNDGDIDANSFQTIAYFNKFKEDHKLNIVSLGNTVLAPMGIYSSSIKKIKDLKNGAKIAIPNDPTNGGRALILLQDAGIIKLKEGVGLLPTEKDIAKNTKNIKIVQLAATQIPRSLKDVDAAAINSGVAVDAGFNPLKDSIYIESTKKSSVKNYFNIIAVRSKDKNNKTLKKLVEVYQTEKVKKLLKDLYKGAQVPAF